MPEQNAATSGANNTEGNNAATAGGANNSAGNNTGGTDNAQTNNNSGTTQQPASDQSQTGATGKIAFTPEQQTFINAQIADEKRKAVAAAMKKAEEEKELSEKEKAEKRAQEAENQLAERDKRDAFKTAIEPAKVVDGNALYQLVGGELEFENGKLKNLTKVLDAAKVSYPYLFPQATGSADAGAKDEKIEIEAKPGVDRMAKAYESSSKS